MRFVSVLLVALALSPACNRTDEPGIDAGPPAARKPASERLKGTWEFDSFAAKDPATAGSVQELNRAAVGNPAVLALRTTYDGERVVISAGSGIAPANKYTVKKDAPDRCVLESIGDTIVIEFRDDNHMSVDRRGNPYGAIMNMKRAFGPAPAAPSDLQLGGPVKFVMRSSPSGSTSVVGSTGPAIAPAPAPSTSK